MEKKKETKLNNDGTYTTTEVIKTTPEDGFVDKGNITNINNNYRNNYKGYSKNTSISTNDPRIIRLFVYGICGLFLGISIFMILIKPDVFWFLCTVFTIFTFFKSKKEIDNREKELLKNANYNPNDKTVIKKFTKEIKENFNGATSLNFTKNKFKEPRKPSIATYIIIISVITTILIYILTRLI